MSTPVDLVLRREDHARHVAVGDEADRGADAPAGGDQIGVARTVEDQRGDLAGLHALGLRERMDVFFRRRVEIDDARGIAGADGDLVHVDVGRVEQRAGLRHRHHRDRARHVLGAQRRAFQRIDGDVDLRARRRAHPLADEQHRRLVALALADDDRAVDGQAVEFAAHRVDGGLVGGLLVAAAAQARGGDGGALGDAHEFERQNALDDVLLFNDEIGHRSSK